MFEDLMAVVQNRVDPSMMDGIKALVEAFELHKCTLYKDQVTFLKMEGDSADAGTITDKLIGILYTQAEALLQQMKIRLNMDEIRIGMLAEIIEALHFVPGDLDDQILAICQGTEDSVDALIEILALKTNKAPEQFMEYVVSVSPFVVAVIQGLANESVEAQKNSEIDIVSVLGKLNKHQSLVGDNVTAAMESLAGGTGVGVSMQTLVDQNLEKLHKGTPQETADHLISLAIMANTEPDAIEDEVCFFLEQMYDDIVDMQKARRHLMSRLGGLAQEFQNE